MGTIQSIRTHLRSEGISEICPIRWRMKISAQLQANPQIENKSSPSLVVVGWNSVLIPWVLNVVMDDGNFFIFSGLTEAMMVYTWTKWIR